MKLKLLISLFFIIATTFISIHELEHIGHDDSSCLICHTNNNLLSADIIDKLQDIEVFHFEKVLEKNFIVSSFAKKHSNQNRAPPLAL